MLGSDDGDGVLVGLGPVGLGLGVVGGDVGLSVGAGAAPGSLPWRVKPDLTLPVLDMLPDGSHSSVLVNPKIRGKARQALIGAARAGKDLPEGGQARPRERPWPGRCPGLAGPARVPGPSVFGCGYDSSLTSPGSLIGHGPDPSPDSAFASNSSGKMPGPARDSGPIKSFATRVCAGQGSDDPFSPGRCRPAGTLRLPLVLLRPWPGVIITPAAHRRPTGWRRMTALAGGVTRYRADRQNRTGRPSRRAGPGLRSWRQLRVRERAGAGNNGAGAWRG